MMNGLFWSIGFSTVALVFLTACQDSRTGPAAPQNGAATQPFPSATPRQIVAVTETIFPAVVRLDVAQEVYREGKRTVQRGIGSGVIIDVEGHILTNYHVAGRGTEIYVTLYNKERVPATLVGDDHWTDLAIVKLDMETIRKRKIGFAHAELGRSDRLTVGQDVIAVGTPFGLARTMTLGIVSNNERTFYPDRQRIDEFETGDFSNWIQMDTPISPGNSGGPLVDLDGKVVGINTRGIQGQALNFAVPIDAAKPVIASILKTATSRKKGRVDRADLGIELKPLQDLESFYAIDINQGVLIDNVDRLSTAAKSGVRTQDILLSINGRPTNVRFPEELADVRKYVADLSIGADVNLSLRRGKETVTLTTRMQKLEGAVGEEREFKQWGMSVRDVTRTFANERQLDDDTGVVVTTLSFGYPAAKAELQAGDVILSVNGKPVVDLDDFGKIYDRSTADKESRVLIGVQRGTRSRQSFILKVGYSNTTTTTSPAQPTPATSSTAPPAVP